MGRSANIHESTLIVIGNTAGTAAIAASLLVKMDIYD
jgi:hypothetical protein